MIPHANFAHLPKDVLIKIFLTFSDIRDTCAASEVCISWSDAALSPECWSYVRAIDASTRRRILQQDATRNPVFDCNVCFDRPTLHPCEACKPTPPRVTGKRKRRRTRLANQQGVKLAVEVITKRAGTRLRMLDLRLCYPFHHISEYQMRNSDLSVIAMRSGALLRGLVISSSVLVSADALVEFARACPQLRVFHMMNCQTLMVSHLAHIVAACPRLEDISVSRCPQFRGQRLMQVLKPLQNTLRRIDMSFTPTESLNMSLIMCSFPVLEEVIADHCSNLKCVVSNFRAMGMDTGGLCTSKLTTLRLDDTQLDVMMMNILFRLAHRLHHLSANHIPLPSRLALERVFEGNIPPLRTLCVASLPISDSIWHRIFDSLHDTIEFCDVSGNSRLTLGLPVGHGKEFSRLKGIHIMNTGTTDRTLAQLLIRSPRLCLIDAAGCCGVRDRRFRRNPLSYKPYLESIVNALGKADAWRRTLLLLDAD